MARISLERKTPPGRRCRRAGRALGASAGLFLLLGSCGDYTLFPEDKIYPEARFTVDKTTPAACETETVTVDGSESTDPGAAEGETLTYAWTLVKPSGSEADFADASAAKTSFKPDRPGDYEITLTVITVRETSAEETATVTATDGPIAVLPSPGSATVDSPVNLVGSGSKNPQADCTSQGLVFRWEFLSVPEGSTAAILPADSETPSFTPNVPGDYQVQMTVLSEGATPSESAATVTVTAAESQEEEEG